MWCITTIIVEFKKSTLQAFTKACDKWQFKCRLPENAPVTYGSCLVNEKKWLYLVGGHANICACAHYTTTTDTWTLLKPPAMSHCQGSAVVSEETIYVCGGGYYDGPNADIEEYNIIEDKWTISSLKLPKPLNFFTAAKVSFL